MQDEFSPGNRGSKEQEKRRRRLYAKTPIRGKKYIPARVRRESVDERQDERKEPNTKDE